jgi:hypothetical protein
VESNNSLPLLTFFGKSVIIVDLVIIHLHYTEQTLSGSAQNEDKIVRIKYENEYKYLKNLRDHLIILDLERSIFSNNRKQGMQRR